MCRSVRSSWLSVAIVLAYYLQRSNWTTFDVVKKMCLCILVLLSISALACAQSYNLSVTRRQDVDPRNELILNCTGAGSAVTFIFRNGVLLTAGSMPIAFTINRTLEGEYSCGGSLDDRDRSPSLPLVGEKRRLKHMPR